MRNHNNHGEGLGSNGEKDGCLGGKCQNNSVDIAAFGSPSAVRGWVEKYGTKDVIAVPIGKTTLQSLQAHDFTLPSLMAADAISTSRHPSSSPFEGTSPSDLLPSNGESRESSSVLQSWAEKIVREALIILKKRQATG